MHYSEAGGDRQPGILKQPSDTLSLCRKDTKTALERQRDSLACLANARTQIVERIRKLLALASPASASALALAPAITVVAVVAIVAVAALPANVVDDFSLELVDDALGVEDALCDLELAARTNKQTPC